MNEIFEVIENVCKDKKLNDFHKIALLLEWEQKMNNILQRNVLSSENVFKIAHIIAKIKSKIVFLKEKNDL